MTGSESRPWPRLPAADQPSVLHVLEAVGGGTARHLMDIVEGVRDFRHLAVVAPRRDGSWLSHPGILVALRAAGTDVYEAPMTRFPASKSNVRAIGLIRALLRSGRVDIVHGHSSVGSGLARVAAIGTGAPVVVTPNALHPGRVYGLLERVLAPLGDAVIAVSESEARELCRRKLVRPEALHTIPNGIRLQATPTARIVARETLARLAAGVPSNARVVGGVLRLAPQKRPIDFVRMAAVVRSQLDDEGVHFVLVGDGSLADTLDRLVERLGLSECFHRARMPQGAGRVIRAFDVFVMPSAYEGGPYAPLEAMQARVPVVLTDCIGNSDVVEDGVSGFLVPVGAVDEMAKAVVRLLRDADLRRETSERAYERLRSRYSLEKQLDSLGFLYRELLVRSSPSGARKPTLGRPD